VHAPAHPTRQSSAHPLHSLRCSGRSVCSLHGIRVGLYVHVYREGNRGRTGSKNSTSRHSQHNSHTIPHAHIQHPEVLPFKKYRNSKFRLAVRMKNGGVVRCRGARRRRRQHTRPARLTDRSHRNTLPAAGISIDTLCTQRH
jgi:hypothetical protein